MLPSFAAIGLILLRACDKLDTFSMHFTQIAESAVDEVELESRLIFRKGKARGSFRCAVTA
jgi:hypothetical protein